MPRHPVKKTPIFGKNLASARRKNGLTQPQLAEILGVSPKAIDYYERRAINPNMGFVKKAAAALGTTPDELIEYKNRRQKPGPSPRILTLIENVLKLPKSKQKMAVQFLETMVKTE